MSNVSVRQPFGTGRRKKGYIKCRLLHLTLGSVVQPDVLLGKSKDRPFFLPIFFDPCQLGFFPEDSNDFCRFSFVANNQACLRVTFFKRNKVSCNPDGSVIYKCYYEKIDGPSWPAPDGRWRRVRSRFELKLFHHTDEKGFSGIVESSQIWGSQWNIQGNLRLKNIAYGYFTNIRKIRHEIDLQQIAMSSAGQAHFLPTNAPLDAQLSTSVALPRLMPHERSQTIGLWIDSSYIAPNHLWIHRPMDRPAYYEIVLPKVFRVGLTPGASVHILDNQAVVRDGEEKIFQYVVVGDADTHDGLVAPYHEEETMDLAKVEVFERDDEIISFWKTHANSDQYTQRILERAEWHAPL